MHKKGLKDTWLVACTLAPFLINSNYLDIFIQDGKIDLWYQEDFFVSPGEPH
jgi:hypothetical protein